MTPCGMFLRLLLCACAAIFSTCLPQQIRTASVPVGYAPRPGDFVFQSLPHNPLIDAIEGSSGSPFSHCGIVKKREVKKNRGNIWMVIEAIGPVKETQLPHWIAQGRGSAYVVFRLREPLCNRTPPARVPPPAISYQPNLTGSPP